MTLVSWRRGVRFLAIVLIANAVGCWSDPVGVFPGLYRLPAGEEPLPDSFWKAAEQHPGEDSEGRTGFPVPGYYASHVFWVDNQAQVADYQAAGAYGPWIGLPFYQGVDERVYTRDGRVLRNRVQWTPFFATTHRGEWPADRPASEAWGIPLFFTRYDNYSGFLDVQASGWQSLWTLGPSYFLFHPQVAGDGGSGYIFRPLTAAGFGDLVWSSYCIQFPNHSIAGHGPLFGMLGYYSSVDRPGIRTPFRPLGANAFRMVLLGSLWFSYESLADDGTVVDAINGPLWGMFGPGLWNGDPVFRVFWMPFWI